MPVPEVASDTDLRTLLLEFEETTHELSRRRRERGMEFYVPNHRQLEVHKASSRTILYVGGNRSGKSTVGAMELCYHLTRKYPDYFAPQRRFTKPIKAVVVATEYPIIDRVIEPKLMSYLPRDAIRKIRRTPQGFISKLVCADGSTVDFLSNEMDDLAFESADWDFYWGDEPQKKTKFFAIQRGLVDRRGQTLLTFTPLSEPWIKNEMVDVADGTRITVITGDIRDNTQDIEGTPILSEEAIAEFEAKMPEDLKQTRIHGKFFHLRGLVYPEFDATTHTWIDTPHLKYQYPDPVVCVLDPHDRLPHHVLWAWFDRQDTCYVDRELVFTGTLKDMCREILLREAAAGYRMAKRLVDPNFGRKPSQVGGGRSVIEELALKPHPLYFGEANDDKEAGRMRVKALLHYDHAKPLSVTNSPKLYFHKDRCPVTIRSVRDHQYDEWKGASKDDKDPKEVEKQKDTHGADCVRYLAITHCTFDRLTHQQKQLHELTEVAY